MIRISKYKNIFVKGCVQNWFEEVFVVKKVKNIVPWTYVISDLKGEEIVGTFYEKKNSKSKSKCILVGKLIKKKGDKPSVNWNGYDSSFNCWIDQKDTV